MSEIVAESGSLIQSWTSTSVDSVRESYEALNTPKPTEDCEHLHHISLSSSITDVVESTEHCINESLSAISPLNFVSLADDVQVTTPLDSVVESTRCDSISRPRLFLNSSPQPRVVKKKRKCDKVETSSASGGKTRFCHKADPQIFRGEF